MNQNLNALYVAITDNEVVAFETNLTKFWDILNKIEPDCPNYKKCYNGFKKSNKIIYANGKNKVYFLQKLM